MNAIEIHGLTKTFADFTLGPIDLTLPSGCIMGLVGENGAGKSTTLKLLLRILHKDAGEISVLGHGGVEHFSAVKEDIGVVLDEVGFPDCLTARQVGRIFGLSYRQWDDAAYTGYLKNLSVPFDKPFKDFSRGTKMKLGIAAALSHHPKLLLLDEATSGLDPIVRDEVLELFSEYTREEGRSILISSHIVSELERLCDYIAFLHKGKIVLSEEKDRIHELYGKLHCSSAQLSALPPSAVLGAKTSPYGVEAIVRRDRLPGGVNVGPVDIEDLFLLMVKEERVS